MRIILIAINKKISSQRDVPARANACQKIKNKITN